MNPVHLESGNGVLAVRWDDGSESTVTHAALRAACPCSECRALRRAGGVIEASTAVRLVAIEAAGSNALNLGFGDGHARGIYPFALLAELVRQPACAAPAP